MTDTRLTPTFLGNTKIDDLDDLAFRVHVNGMVYAGSHETDGHIPRRALRHLHPEAVDLLSVAEQLVKAGVWEAAPEGYVVHDFLHHQTPRAVLEQRREQEREKKRKQRQNRSPGERPGGTPLGDRADVPGSSVGQDRDRDRTGLGQAYQDGAEVARFELTPYLRKWAASRGWPDDGSLDRTLIDWGPLTEAQWCRRLRESTEPSYEREAG